MANGTRNHGQVRIRLFLVSSKYRMTSWSNRIHRLTTSTLLYYLHDCSAEWGIKIRNDTKEMSKSRFVCPERFQMCTKQKFYFGIKRNRGNGFRILDGHHQVLLSRYFGANFTMRIAPIGDVLTIANTDTINTILAMCASTEASLMPCKRIWSNATGPRAACTVAFGKLDIVTYSRSFQFNCVPNEQPYAMMSRICWVWEENERWRESSMDFMQTVTTYDWTSCDN